MKLPVVSLLIGLGAVTAFGAEGSSNLTDPKERLRLFGQEDHVRCYGPDYVDRLREAGFDVQVFLPSDLVSPEEISRYGLGAAAGEICLCTCPIPAVGVS